MICVPEVSELLGVKLSLGVCVWWWAESQDLLPGTEIKWKGGVYPAGLEVLHLLCLGVPVRPGIEVRVGELTYEPEGVRTLGSQAVPGCGQGAGGAGAQDLLLGAVAK